ncbi:MAG: hypothetical protein DRP71_11735 [Verrucomicrobia bacterium]|nr:MAG: hypothetical protein DRP71_11735 [Verrucomicrobiota bacterium]
MDGRRKTEDGAVGFRISDFGFRIGDFGLGISECGLGTGSLLDNGANGGSLLDILHVSVRCEL